MSNAVKKGLLLLCLIGSKLFAAPHFTITDSREYAGDIDINLYDKAQHIGFVSYTKAFLLPIYAIHNLYVYPEHRMQGYGKQLLLYACAVIKRLGARVAYIQPGPFEIVGGRTIGIIGDQYEQKMKQLVVFYEKYGFKKVHPATSWLASFLYKMMGINEDARYLMVKWL